MLTKAARSTPISIATEFFTGSLLVTRKMAVRICGPITMIRDSGRICSWVVVEDNSRPFSGGARSYATPTLRGTLFARAPAIPGARG